MTLLLIIFQQVTDACIGLDIKAMSPFEMLRKERVRFVLADNVGANSQGASN